MNRTLRPLVVILIGLGLLVAPYLVSLGLAHPAASTYQPPQADLPDLAVTAIPTTAPAPVTPEASSAQFGPGSVVVDLAHFSDVGPTRFQPLAGYLAAYGVDLDFWMNEEDAANIDFSTMADLPDQSQKLAELLQDAAGLVVINPAFWWTADEIEVAQEFVADGGRLVIINDPDIAEPPEFFYPDMNSLSEPFGIVFNNDYLFNLTHNDLNFTHVYQADFTGQAAGLAGSTIVFYGTRSISGPAVPQVLTGDETLSSLRTGLTGFTTAAIGGLSPDGTGGNVLALGDFDVLTEPYVNRYDNQKMANFVAQFLAGSRRVDTLTDFPAYLGQDVALVFGPDGPLDATLLQASSTLQELLLRSGRTMSLAAPDTTVLSTTTTLAGEGTADVIYAASYATAARDTLLLQNAGIRLVTPAEEDVSPVGPAGSGTELLPGDVMTATGQIDETGPASAALSATEETTGTAVLETSFGPSFNPQEITLFLRQQLDSGTNVTAVLVGDDDQHATLRAGLDRLQNADFGDCLTFPDLVICPAAEKQSGAEEGAEQPGDSGLPSLPESTEPLPLPDVTSDTLLIDDDQYASGDELSEADIYLTAMLDYGYYPDTWSTALNGLPQLEDLSAYRWVIWSAGEYADNSLGYDELDMLMSYLQDGGIVTLSGRRLSPDLEQGTATELRDVVITDALPDLVTDLPDTPVDLEEGLPAVVPLGESIGEAEVTVLRRGANSEDADSPVMKVIADSGSPSRGQPQVIAIAMSLTWLPADYANQLIGNMALWTSAE